MRPAARILDVQMRERLPAPTETKNLDVVLAATVLHTDGVANYLASVGSI
jgi:hypothetical protein